MHFPWLIISHIQQFFTSKSLHIKRGFTVHNNISYFINKHKEYYVLNFHQLSAHQLQFVFLLTQISRSKYLSNCYTYWMDNGPNKVVVINRLQNNLNISLQQSRLHKKLGFFCIRHLCCQVWFSFIIKFESRALKNKNKLFLYQGNKVKMMITSDNFTHLNARNHECDVIEVWQQESSHSGPISHMLNDSFYRFPTTLIHKIAWIVYRPFDISHVFLMKMYVK